MKEISFNDLGAQWMAIEQDALPDLISVFKSGGYIGGAKVEEFERAFATYTDSKYAVGVSNGTDGLVMALRALSLPKPCLVLLPANTFIAAAIAVAHQPDGGYEIRLVDIDDYFLMDLTLIESTLETSRTNFKSCVIMATHLYGQPMNMQELRKIADRFDCHLIEDASQAHGAKANGEELGKLSSACVYSLYPGKGLGALGDAGIITTDSLAMSDRLKSLRNYGSSSKYHYDELGWNNRLDAIQAVALTHKLKYLDDWNKRKNQIARQYSTNLAPCKQIKTPEIAGWVDNHVFHIYCVRVSNREKLQDYLKLNGVPTIMHYPIPIQLTKPFKYLNDIDQNVKTKEAAKEILSLPIHPFMSSEDVEFITQLIIKFYVEP
jgi:dTDP-4-amino-4,6-dideoxygalactose transaminase